VLSAKTDDNQGGWRYIIWQIATTDQGIVLSATQKLLRFGVFELNLNSEELRKDGLPLRLPPQPFKILALLASRAGQLITREEIQRQVWGEETYVDFDHGLNQCVKQIRTVLNDNSDRPVYVETVPRRGYRFLAPVVSKTVPAPPPKVVESTSGIAPALAAIGGPPTTPTQRAPATSPEEVRESGSGSAVAVATAPAAESASATTVRRRIPWFALLAGGLLLAALVASWLYWSPHKVAALTERDTVVLADFANSTGDPVFDDSMKQALAVDLSQSPFLNFLSDRDVSDTLRRMERPSGTPVTPEIAGEICVRTGSKAVLSGYISSLGTEYVVRLVATSCSSGDSLAKEQVEARRKEDVLKALDTAAVKLRRKLGESLGSVQKYDVPLEQATTSSLEALKAYSLGMKMRNTQGNEAAVPLFKRAIELDPNFAIAYAQLGIAYSNLSQPAMATANIAKAYQLRDSASEREKLIIAAQYDSKVTGDLSKAKETNLLLRQIYPRDPSAYTQLTRIYTTLGSYDQALAEVQTGMQLSPVSNLNYGNLTATYINLGRFDEANAALQQAKNHALTPQPPLSYYLAFLRGDDAEMKRQAAADPDLGRVQADTEAYFGRLASARDLIRTAQESEVHEGSSETAALLKVDSALYEAELGDAHRARQDALQVLTSSGASSYVVQVQAALALARIGDSSHALAVVRDLDKQFPSDTMVNYYWGPTIRAATALNEKDPHAAIEALQATAPYELGSPPSALANLYPVYLRGLAYLETGQGQEAAREFRKIIDHRGVIVNFPTGALARLQLARAQLMMGDTENARKSYQDFLALWKDADQDIPILQQAKAEYRRLPGAG
jgi:DNA-binding winged helix-turn-helix (wHTH) protein/tetratricopeptide (TPR) repeat protein